MNDCIFCKIIKGEIPSYKVYEDEHTCAFFDINPKNDYHTLVIPKKHYADMFDIPEDEAVRIMQTIKKIISHYSERLGIINAQIMCNSGKDAQQDVFHLHYHIVPRYPGDGQNCIWPKAVETTPARFEELLSALN